MISDKTRLKIANCMYANVAVQLAMFNNPKFRGSNFNWKWFIGYCEENADLWLMIANIRGSKNEINETAKQMAKEIATTLVNILEK